MTDLTITATITRDELELDPLSLNEPPYKLAGRLIDVGRVARRRQVAESVFVHGGVEIGSVKEMATIAVGIDVFGDTLIALKANLDTLIEAFEQHTYTIGYNVDGAEFGYLCNAADWETGLSTQRLSAKRVAVVFECPRVPGVGVG